MNHQRPLSSLNRMALSVRFAYCLRILERYFNAIHCNIFTRGKANSHIATVTVYTLVTTIFIFVLFYTIINYNGFQTTLAIVICIGMSQVINFRTSFDNGMKLSISVHRSFLNTSSCTICGISSKRWKYFNNCIDEMSVLQPNTTCFAPNTSNTPNRLQWQCQRFILCPSLHSLASYYMIFFQRPIGM